MSNAYDFSGLSESFKALIGNPGLNLQFYDMNPTPIEIFSADGTSIYMNRAAMEMTGVTDASLIVNKYNFKNDPVCAKIVGDEIIERVFRGEAVTFPDFPAPVQDLVDRGVIEEKPWETATMDIFFLPVWDGDIFICTICFFNVKNMYKGRADIIRVKEYIDNNWLGEFDSKAVAKAFNISHAHLRALFKQHTGMTMHDYYKKIKVEHIKEKLTDRRLSVAEAFAACGEDSRGAFARVFKEVTGVSPKEFRSGSK